MKTKCPHCGQHCHVDDGAVGTVITCENCWKDFTVSEAAAETPKSEPSPSVANNPTPNAARCPSCGGEIAPGEKKCRHCGKRLKKGLRPLIIVLAAIGAGILLVFLLGLILLLLLLLPALHSARERAYTVNCVSNLKNIGMVVFTYQADNRSYMPDPYMLKRGKYIHDDDRNPLLCCPASKKKYVFLGRGTQMSSIFDMLGGNVRPSNIPIVVERVPHQGRVNVLYVEGHVGSVYLPRKNMSTREIVEFLLDEAGVKEEWASGAAASNIRQFRAKWLEDAEKAE